MPDTSPVELRVDVYFPRISKTTFPTGKRACVSMAMAAFVEAPSFVFARFSFRAVSDVHAARHEIGPPMRAVNRRRHVHTYVRIQTYTWRFRVPV
jgi:hypothetical protein